MLAAAACKQCPPRIDPELWTPLGRVCTPRLTVCTKLQLRCNSRKPLTCANAVSASTSNTQSRTYPKEGRAHPRGAYVLWSGTRPPCAVRPPPPSTHVPRSIGNVFAREAYLRSSTQDDLATRHARSAVGVRPPFRAHVQGCGCRYPSRGWNSTRVGYAVFECVAPSDRSERIGRAKPLQQNAAQQPSVPVARSQGRARTRCAPARPFLRPVVHRERRRPCVVHSRQSTQRMWLVGLCTRLMG